VRVLLYTGKGGVGKTTVAAATAVRCAELGYRTLIISTDAAHSLGDSLDVALGDQPVQVAENLWAQEVNALLALESHWQKIHGYLSTLFASQGLSEIVAEELATPPGMEEIASLMWIKHHKDSGQFDVLVIDCAPTGETLQLLAFPDVVRWYLNKIFPIQRRVAKLARPALQPFISIPLPKDDIFEAVKLVLLDLDGMKKIIGDPKVCTVRIVLNLEKMVIKEAQRAFTYLSLYDYLTDLVVVNRVLPPEVTDGYFDNWHAAQGRYSELVEHAFSPVPIRQSKLFDHEIVGLVNLSEMAETLYDGEDPSQIFYSATPQKLVKVDGHYEFELSLPFVEKSEVVVRRGDDNLFVTIGPYKREISLPRVLVGREVEKAKLEDGMLRISFN
jgi:arsenite-transporting ATPase